VTVFARYDGTQRTKLDASTRLWGHRVRKGDTWLEGRPGSWQEDAPAARGGILPRSCRSLRDVIARSREGSTRSCPRPSVFGGRLPTDGVSDLQPPRRARRDRYSRFPASRAAVIESLKSMTTSAQKSACRDALRTQDWPPRGAVMLLGRVGRGGGTRTKSQGTNKEVR